MYEKILVPLDGSELAQVALPYAEELAGRLGSEIILVFVSELAEDPNRHMHQFYLEKMVESEQCAIERYFKKSEGRAIQVRSAILVGNPAEKIVEYAEKEGISLIVLATHGRCGITRWALGSVANKVVRATKRPVALIRARGARPDVREKGILHKAVVPLDGSKVGEAAVSYIEELAARLKAELILLQVLALGYNTITAEGYEYVVYSEKQMASDRAFARAYLDGIGARLKGKGIVTGSEVRFGSAAEEIIKLADEIHADVVVMSTHGRSGVGRFVFGSVAERVLCEGNTPLLLIRAPGAVTD